MPDKEANQGFIRHKYRDLEPSSSDSENKSYAQYVSLGPATPLGHTEISVSAGGVALSNIPAEARRLVLYAVGADVTFCDDGTEPSGSHGMIIPADSLFIYDTEPTTNFKLWSAATTDVRLAYYG